MLLFFIVFIAQENGDRTSFGCWQLGSNSETASMFSSILLNTCVELYFCVEAVFTRYCTCIILAHCSLGKLLDGMLSRVMHSCKACRANKAILGLIKAIVNITCAPKLYATFQTLTLHAGNIRHHSRKLLSRRI